MTRTLRSRLRCVKHFFLAGLLLMLLLAAGEIGLRVYDSSTGEFSRTRDEDELIARSWRTHHGLKPLRSITRPNPDSGAPVLIRTNGYGIRGGEIAVPKPAGVFRILCLGDHLTFAPDVPESETFCARLQELLQSRSRLRIEVINAGVPGYCPLLSCLQVKHSLLSLQPDVLLLNFDMSDVADDHAFRRHTHLDREGGVLACPHPDLEPRPSRKPPGWDDRLLLARWLKQRSDWLSDGPSVEDRGDIGSRQGRYAWLKDNPPDWSTYIQQALSPIEELGATADSIYARLIVAACCCPWQVSPRACSAEVRTRFGIAANAMYHSRAPFDLLGAWLGRRGIAFCDTSPGFQNAPSPEELFLREAPRFSAAGHELYARQLAQFLMERIPGIWNSESPYSHSLPHAARWENSITR